MSPSKFAYIIIKSYEQFIKFFAHQIVQLFNLSNFSYIKLICNKLVRISYFIHATYTCMYVPCLYTKTIILGDMMFLFIVDSNKCPFLDAPTDGFVVIRGFRHGDNASYFCNADYIVMSGDHARQCMTNGQWSGQAPTCQST